MSVSPASCSRTRCPSCRPSPPVAPSRGRVPPSLAFVGRCPSPGRRPAPRRPVPSALAGPGRPPAPLRGGAPGDYLRPDRSPRPHGPGDRRNPHRRRGRGVARLSCSCSRPGRRARPVGGRGHGLRSTRGRDRRRRPPRVGGRRRDRLPSPRGRAPRGRRRALEQAWDGEARWPTWVAAPTSASLAWLDPDPPGALLERLEAVARRAMGGRRRFGVTPPLGADEGTTGPARVLVGEVGARRRTRVSSRRHSPTGMAGSHPRQLVEQPFGTEAHPR